MTAWIAEEEGCSKMELGEKSEYCGGSKISQKSGFIAM
jgi:hypothetical protein